MPMPSVFYVQKTLLGCSAEKDRNRRIVCFQDTEIATFNQRMDVWHPDDNDALNRLVSFLNANK